MNKNATNNRKEQLLATSINLFAQHGYDSVSVRDIAKAAGLSEAALYKHFTSKQEMALSIFSSIILQYTNKIKRLDSGSAIVRLQQIVDITYDFYIQNPDAIRFALLSQHSFWELVANDHRPHLVIKQILLEGIQHGEIPQQPVNFWITIFAGILLEPLTQYPYFADDLPSLDELKTKVKLIVIKVFSQDNMEV